MNKSPKMRSNLRFLKRQYVDQYLASNPCVDCRESDPIVLDFDHLRNKTKNISTMIRDSSTMEELQAEIKKCVVRCANDHRRATRMRERGFEV